MLYTRIFFTSVFVLLLTGWMHSTNAQSKIDLEAGASFPEGAHIGGRLHYSDYTRLDLKAGTDFRIYDNDNTFTLTLNHAFYFGKKNENIARKTWTFNTAPVFTYYNDEYEEVRSALLSIYFAKEIVVARRIILEPELGIWFFLKTKTKKKKESLPEGCVTIPFSPKFGLNLVIPL